MTKNVSICLRSLRIASIAIIFSLATSTAFSAKPGCATYLKGKKIAAHDAADAIDVIASLYNSNKTLAYDFITSKKGEPNLIDLLKPQVNIILNFSKRASKEARLRFQKIQSAEYKNAFNSRFHNARNDYEELSKLTGTLMLVRDSGSQYAKEANLLAANLTIFFAEIGLPFSVPKALEEAKLRDKQLSAKFFETRVQRLKYNYALLILANAHENQEAIKTLKTYASELMTDHLHILEQIEDLGGVITNQDEEVQLVLDGKHPGQFERYRPRQRDLQQETWLERLLNRFN